MRFEDWMDPIRADCEEDDAVRVTEATLPGDRACLFLRESVCMHDVLWFSPRPPPIESGEIPYVRDEPESDGRSSVAPMAMSTEEIEDERPESEARVRGWTSINPLIAAGILGAIVVAAHLAQPERHGSQMAALALAFPDEMVIDMREEPQPVWVYDLPVAQDEPRLAANPTAPLMDRTRPTLPRGFLGVKPLAPTGASPRLMPPQERLAPFSHVSAATALSSVAGAVRGCLPATTGSVRAEVQVSFAPSGQATQAVVLNAPFAGTPAGGCVARVFRGARMEPFEGPIVTVHKTVAVR